MEIHFYRVSDQIYSIWIWLHHLTVQLKSSTLDWQERMALYVMWACVCVCVACLFLRYGGRPWCPQQHAAAGRPPLSLPWGEQLLHKHVGVWAMSLWLSSSPSLLLLPVCSHTDTERLTSTLSIFSTFKHSNVPLPAVTFPSASFTFCFHLEKKKIELGLSCSLPKSATVGLLTSKQIEGYSGA